MKKASFGIILPIVLISYFMILLDNSVVFTSTVKISQQLQMNAQLLSWVSNAYVLTFGGLQLFGGRLGDLVGRKKIFLVGLTIFTLSSLLVGLSINATMMITMRAIQGIGAAILAPTTLALLIDNYQGALLSRAIAYYGATAGLGASFGLLIGGFIASFTSWRVGFLINVPVGIMMFILTTRYVQEHAKLKNIPIDIQGTIFSIIGISGIIYGINGSKEKLVSLIIGIVFLVVFILREQRATVPLMPLELFKSPIRVGAYISRFFIIGMAFTFLYLAPQAMQNVYHDTPFLASVMFLFMNIPQFIAATLVPRLTAKFSNAKMAAFASLISVIALLWIVMIGVQRGFWLSLMIPMILLGIGQGFAISPLTSLGVAGTTGDVAGSASGVVNTFHQTGQSTGLAIAIALTHNISNPAASFNTAMLIIAGYAFISLIATTVISRFDK